MPSTVVSHANPSEVTIIARWDWDNTAAKRVADRLPSPALGPAINRDSRPRSCFFAHQPALYVKMSSLLVEAWFPLITVKTSTVNVPKL
jgi:hypothetical protein